MEEERRRHLDGATIAGGGTVPVAVLWPGEAALVVCGAPGRIARIERRAARLQVVVAGTGVPMFGDTFLPTAFTPTDRQTFSNGAQVTSFDRT